MSNALDPQEKAIRAAERAYEKVDGKRRGDERDAFYAAVVAAHAEGASYAALGERLGISGTRVHQIVRDHG